MNGPQNGRLGHSGLQAFTGEVAAGLSPIGGAGRASTEPLGVAAQARSAQRFEEVLVGPADSAVTLTVVFAIHG